MPRTHRASVFLLSLVMATMAAGKLLDVESFLGSLSMFELITPGAARTTGAFFLVAEAGAALVLLLAAVVEAPLAWRLGASLAVGSALGHAALTTTALALGQAPVGDVVFGVLLPEPEALVVVAEVVVLLAWSSWEMYAAIESDARG
jgi:hypothetical protein